MFGTIKRSTSHAKIAKQNAQTHSLTFLTLVFCVVFYKFLLPERFVNFYLDGFPLSKKNHKRCQNRHDFCIASRSRNQPFPSAFPPPFRRSLHRFYRRNRQETKKQQETAIVVSVENQHDCFLLQ